MITVRRANVILDIKESEVDRYITKGFSVIDDKGNVLKEAEPITLEQFQKAYNELRVINEKLVKENEALKAEVQSLKTKPTTKSTTRPTTNRTRKVVQ